MTKKIQNPEISKEKIHDALLKYQKAKDLSLTDIATQTRVSTATLSKITRFIWDDISEATWLKIWVRVSEGEEMIISTKDFTAVHQACGKARTNHLMIGITGDTGTGKTTALEVYSRRKNVYYLVYDATMRAKQFFIQLLREMGISFEGSLHDMVNRAADELNTISRPLIIIDESGKLNQNMILYLHVLRDKTSKNCGIILGGMPYFYTNLVKKANKQREGYAEFLRRVNVWHELEGLTRSEVEFICNQYGITDKETIQSLKNKKCFGDLVNAIIIHQIESHD